MIHSRVQYILYIKKTIVYTSDAIQVLRNAKPLNSFLNHFVLMVPNEYMPTKHVCTLNFPK